MEFLIIIAAALLPAVLLWGYIWKMDRKKEPTSLLIKATCYGVLICLPVAIVESMISGVLFGEGGPTTLFGTTVDAFMVAAIPEEAFKLFALHRILKNNPTVEYKNRGSFNVGAFASVSQFTYDGKKFVGLATNGSQCGMKVQIHINCEPEGFKDGPYVFPEILKLGVTEAELLANGFRPSTKWGNKFHFPMDDFVSTAMTHRHKSKIGSKLSFILKSVEVRDFCKQGHRNNLPYSRYCSY